MRHLSISILALSAFLPSVSAAEPSAALMASVESNPRYDSVDYADLDGDGVTEALAVDSTSCTDAGCLFTIFEDDAPGIRIAAHQYGQDPELVSAGRVIDASGVYWTWTGTTLLPWADLLGAGQTYTGSAREVALVKQEAPWFDEVFQADLKVVNVDVTGDSGLEKFISLSGVRYMTGREQPYFIFDADGSLIDKGHSTDLPSIFRRHDTGDAVILTPSPDGWVTKILQN